MAAIVGLAAAQYYPGVIVTTWGDGLDRGCYGGYCNTNPWGSSGRPNVGNPLPTGGCGPYGCGCSGYGCGGYGNGYNNGYNNGYGNGYGYGWGLRNLNNRVVVNNGWNTVPVVSNLNAGLRWNILKK